MQALVSTGRGSYRKRQAYRQMVNLRACNWVAGHCRLAFEGENVLQVCVRFCTFASWDGVKRCEEQSGLDLGGKVTCIRWETKYCRNKTGPGRALPNWRWFVCCAGKSGTHNHPTLAPSQGLFASSASRSFIRKGLNQIPKQVKS